MEYRREIDGLRAVAILPVILVHTQFGLLPGGFTGVDVFFVISGYLITRILVADFEDGRFSAVGFYARRVRRLVPALAVMVAGTALLAWALLMPSDLDALGKPALATAAYGSNLWFYAATDYFTAPDAELLLHTWSLGVEEQFYLVYPALLLAARRWWRGPLWQVLAVIWAASFAGALAWGRTDPSAAFYLLPTRMWELVTGGLVALLPARSIGARTGGAIALAGLALILAGYRFAMPGALFPAPLALLPCLGAALVIIGGAHGPAARVLSIGPAVLVGKWSYSVYLWHWPIAAIWRLNAGATSDRQDKLTILALVFVAGILSHYLVERPAMKRLPVEGPAARRTILLGIAALPAVAAGVFALAGTERADPTLRDYDNALAYRDTADFAFQYRWNDCFGDTMAPACLERQTDKPLVVLAGDSFAAQYRRALEEALPGNEVLATAVTGCAPLILPPSADRCARQYAPLLALVDRGEVARVIIAARWDPAMLPGLEKALARLKAAKVPVTVIGPTVEYDGDMPRFLAAAHRWGDPGLIAQARRDAPFSLDAVMANRAAAGGAEYISQIELECPRGSCRTVTTDGTPYHFDFGHLTLAAAREMVQLMSAAKLASP